RHTRFKCDWSSDVCSSDLSRNRLRQDILHPMHQSETIYRRHYQVQNYYVRRLPPNGLDCLICVVRDRYCVLVREEDPEQISPLDVIVDDQQSLFGHTVFHASLPWLRTVTRPVRISTPVLAQPVCRL